MEGLLIAEELRRVQPLLPARRQSWRFPDAATFVLPMGETALWLYNRPPNPRIELAAKAPPPGRSHSGFQDLLAARAVGDLVGAGQRMLDRVLTLEFGPGEGFVETPATRLVVELTGRNCNLILLDERDVVLGAAREIRSDVNRFREVVAGRPYVPPPPYDKVDPRVAGRDELRALLTDRRLRDVRKLVDGVGPQLSRTLAAVSGIAEDARLGDAEVERVLDALDELATRPAATVRRSLGLPDAETLRRRELERDLRERLGRHLRRELELVEKRLGDIDRADAAAGEAVDLRRRGDLLLAFANQVPSGADSVTLPDFSGKPLTVELDPRRNAAANAQSFYERARKREERSRQAASRRPELVAKREELAALLESLDGLSREELERLSERFVPRETRTRRSGPGARYSGPQGHTILVGRSARENDEITFRIARSRDVWLHVQGYHGAHVLVQAEGREVPFETILFAARLAAGHSKAAESDNVPVDYTLRKNVWKPKGQPPGAVNFTGHKTVWVTPSRRPVVDAEEDPKDG